LAEPKAGRELDALVAERVMGKRVVARDWPCGYAPDCGHYEADLFAHEAVEEGVAFWYNERGPVMLQECLPVGNASSRMG
jgi:hypothetical protein